MNRPVHIAIRTGRRASLCVFPPRCGLSGQTALVHFQIDGGNESNIRRYTVSRTTCYNVAGDKLVSKYGE